MSDHASPSGYAAAKGHVPRESGHLHDSRVPPDWQCSRSIEPPPNNSTGGGTFAASPKEFCAGHCVQRHQRCGGRGPCHGSPSSCLATLAQHGHGRQGDGLRDFGGLTASPRPTPGVISDSEDEQPHFPGGC